ncbi:hypothetical protein AMS68_003192 [Peltaster fructicola]|uniref:Mitochondrial distribution and morphology protein family 31/32 n=1 Tax=Peltaster fructicola TaxID=286661 RepID=A0A6H0XSQ4_9PEZI|nr:hypothetical protein AMS68_003192 [Peltaster fructicola]
MNRKVAIVGRGHIFTSHNPTHIRSSQIFIARLLVNHPRSCSNVTLLTSLHPHRLINDVSPASTIIRAWTSISPSTGRGGLPQSETLLRSVIARRHAFSTLHRTLEKSQKQDTTESIREGLAASSTGKHVIDRLSHIHRPTKAELLAAATGFWHRLGIRFKWFSIRSGRPFNFDEIFAFASWIFWGHVLWIFIGTTTFVSLAILAFNTVFAQETLAKWIGNYLTQSSGLRVVFESAIVPKWKSGVISFSNVFVSRRPGINKRDQSVSKGSQTAAAAAAAASHLVREKDDVPGDDGNYTQFDVTIETVNVTLSFTKWFNGRGLLHDVEVKGVRGVIDRTSVHNTGGWGDPKSWRHEHHAGDFEIDDFKMEDVLLTVHQPNGFRPFTVSMFNCELPRLRKQWLFYDFLSARTMSGSFDNSLFTIHPRQVHNYTGVPLVDGAETGPSQWKKQSRMRIDGLKIDHLNRGVEGPFGWISEGNVDIVADVMLPHDEEGGIAKLMSSLYDQVEATVTHGRHPRETNYTIDNRHTDDRENDTRPIQTPIRDDRYVIFDVRIHLNDVRASIPIFNNDLSYVNNALVRPIVAYINSRRSFIPITCRIVKPYNDFDGSWTFFDSGLLDELSREVYDAFVRDITDGDVRMRRMKQVGLWTLQVAAQALFLGLAGQLA